MKVNLVILKNHIIINYLLFGQNPWKTVGKNSLLLVKPQTSTAWNLTENWTHSQAFFKSHTFPFTFILTQQNFNSFEIEW